MAVARWDIAGCCPKLGIPPYIIDLALLFTHSQRRLMPMNNSGENSSLPPYLRAKNSLKIESDDLQHHGPISMPQPEFSFANPLFLVYAPLIYGVTLP